MADTATRTTEAQPITSPAATPARAQRKNLLTLLAAVVAVALIGYGAYYLVVDSHYVSTDNAYVGADTAQITPLVAAPVAQVLVHETENVQAGQVLVQLDPSDARLTLLQARAELARANADFSRSRIDLSRRRALAPGGAVSADELSTAQNSYSTAIAARAAAEARVQAAQLDLARMTIRSPIAGVVSHKDVDVGQRVEAGRPLMVIAPITDAYVDANFKEVQLTHVAIGQPVTLHADLYGNSVTYHGTVKGLSGGTGAAFSLIPAQNASGNWIKVVQRVPVRVQLDPRELQAHPLRVGMSMSAKIDIAGAH